MTRLTELQFAELKEAFLLLDYDKDGRIFTRDIGAVVRCTGLKPAEFEIRDMQAEVDASYGGTVDLQTLVNLIAKKVSEPESERPADMLEIFHVYDKQRSGFISVDEMRHMLTTVGERLSDEEADRLIKEVGPETNGSISYEKFIRTVMS